MIAVTGTLICWMCKNVVDVFVVEYGNTYTREEALKKRKDPGSSMAFFTCPRCGSKRNLTKWNKTRKPCPKCDGSMEKDMDGIVQE